MIQLYDSKKTKQIKESMKMKTRVLVVALVVAMTSILFLGGQEARAQTVDAVRRSVIYDFFTALNLGDMESARSAFVDTASVGSSVGSPRFVSAVDLAATLDSWQREGREYRVLQESTINVARGLDVVFSDLEIADRGLVWGRQSIRGLVYNGQIQRLDIAKTRLISIPYSQP